MDWLKKIVQRKLMAVVLNHVIAFIRNVDIDKINSLDLIIDAQIQKLIVLDWLEELALDAEQVIIDDLVKVFLPDIKVWCEKNIKTIFDHANAREPNSKLLAAMASDLEAQGVA